MKRRLNFRERKYDAVAIFAGGYDVLRKSFAFDVRGLGSPYLVQHEDEWNALVGLLLMDVIVHDGE